MSHPLSKLERANYNKKRVIIALVVVIIILLLLRKAGTSIFNNKNYDLPGLVVPGVSVTPDYNSYTLPGINVPGPGNLPDLYDWIQSCDGMCECDQPDYTPASGDIYPTYIYVSQPVYATALPDLSFPVYTPPPPPTWWIDNNATGFTRYTARTGNLHWVPLSVIRTSDGLAFQYDYTYRYLTPRSVINQGDYVLNDGKNLYYNGTRYVHKPEKDRYADVYLGVASGGSWG